MNRPLLAVDDLHVRFRTYSGTVHAVNGMTFHVNSGEIFGLVGDSGCGKSVTGYAILRLVPPPGEIVQGRMVRIEGRTKAGWRSLLDGDGNRAVFPVVNCAKHHRFEFAMERGVLLDQIGLAIEAARGAEFGLLEPSNGLRSPGEARKAMA